MTLKLSPYNFKRYTYPKEVGWLGWIETKRDIIYIDLQGKMYHWKPEKVSCNKKFNPSYRW